MEPEAAASRMEQLQQLADAAPWPQPPEELQQQAAALNQLLLQHTNTNSSPSPEDLVQTLQAVADFMALGQAHIKAMHMAMQQQSGAYAALMLQCLKHSNQDVVREAVRAISSLAEFGGCCVALLAQDDMFDLLVQCCWHTSSPMVLQRAAATANRLSQGLWQVYTPAEQASAVCSVLQRCLDSEVGSKYALEQALIAVHTVLLQGGAETLAWCRHPGALQLTLRCVQHGNTDVAEVATGVLTLISEDEAACSVLQQAGALWGDTLQALVCCLSSSSTVVIGDAAVVIGNVASTKDSGTALSQQAGLAAALLRSLEHADPNIVEAAAYAIHQISSNSRGAFSNFTEQPGAVRALIGCLKSGSEQAMAQAAQAVHNMAGQEASRAELLQHGHGGVLKALAMCLRKDGTAAAVAAADAIGHIAIQEDGCPAVLQQHATVFPALAACLSHEDSDVVHAATWAISNILEEGGVAALQRTAVLPALARALTHPSPAIRKDALRGMQRVTGTAVGCTAFMQQEGALSAVVACLSGDDALKQMAINTLEELRENVPGAGPAIWEAVAQEVKSNAQKAEMEELQRNVIEAVVGLAGRVRGTG